MQVEALYQQGLIVTLDSTIKVFYDSNAYKVKVIRESKIVNAFTVDPETYTLSAFLDYVSTLTQDNGN